MALPGADTEGPKASSNVRAKARVNTAEPASPSRREEIVRIAGRLFAERGFLATTIRDIADAADILSGSLYHHFTSKESIADEILQAYWSDLMDRYDEVMAAETDPTETLQSLIRASILLFEPHGHAVRLMLNDWSYLATARPYVNEYLSRTQETWTKVIKSGMEADQFNNSLDPVLAYRTIMGSITGTARWYRPGGSVGLEDLAREMTRVFLTGLMARPPSVPRKTRPKAT